MQGGAELLFVVVERGAMSAVESREGVPDRVPVTDQVVDYTEILGEPRRARAVIGALLGTAAPDT